MCDCKKRFYIHLEVYNAAEGLKRCSVEQIYERCVFDVSDFSGAKNYLFTSTQLTPRYDYCSWTRYDNIIPPQATSHSNHKLQMYTIDRWQTIFIYIFLSASYTQSLRSLASELCWKLHTIATLSGFKIMLD